MSVLIIKSKMKALTEICGHTINACSAVTSSLNGVSGGNISPLITNVERLISCVAQINYMVKILYSDTSSELHILFSDYNRELLKYERYGDRLIKDLYEVLATALKIIALQAIDSIGDSFGKNVKFDIDTSSEVHKMKSNVSSIMEYKMKVTLLQMKTAGHNKELKVKEGNFV